MSLTVVLTNYLRPQNTRTILDALYRQTVSLKVFVWDNAPSQGFCDVRVDWVIRSSKNAQCSPRWWMASHAETDFVLILDDDLLLTESRVLAWTIERAVKTAPFCVGATGVMLQDGSGYWDSRHVGLRSGHAKTDTRVDILKGCYFCAPTRQLASLGYLTLNEEDDIAVSACLGKGVDRPHLVLGQVQEHLRFLPQEDVARKHRPTHRAARDAARWRWFKKTL